MLEDVVLQPGAPYKHLWRLSTSGQYSTKSAYKALFQGVISFEPTDRVWKTWAPGKCKVFMGLVEHNICSTSDKLAKQGCWGLSVFTSWCLKQSRIPLRHGGISLISECRVNLDEDSILLWFLVPESSGSIETSVCSMGRRHEWQQLSKWLGIKPCCGPWPESRICPSSWPWAYQVDC
jgi:hypothetical protein